MKTYLRVWLRGVGVLGLYLWLTIVLAVVLSPLELLPEGAQSIAAVLLLIFVVPPVLQWCSCGYRPEGFLWKGRIAPNRQDSEPK